MCSIVNLFEVFVCGILSCQGIADQCLTTGFEKEFSVTGIWMWMDAKLIRGFMCGILGCQRIADQCLTTGFER